MGILTKFLTSIKTFIVNKRANSIPIIESYRTFRIGRCYFANKYKYIEKRITNKSYYKCIKFRENSKYSFLHQAIFDLNFNVINIILSKKYARDPDVINDDDNNLSLTPCHLAYFLLSIILITLKFKSKIA